MAKLELFCHSSIKISGQKQIYIDPYKIKENFNDADYIFCTHSHYDHFSVEDIEKVKNNNTKIITVKTSQKEAEKLVGKENVLIVEPNKEYKAWDIKFNTTVAYNQNKQFHLKENNWVGFIIEFEGIKYYISGDTDDLEELHNIKCDIALIPIGGTYTMDYKEAANLANNIDAKVVIPTHYGLIVGNKEDAIKFKELVKGKEVKILI